MARQGTDKSLGTRIRAARVAAEKSLRGFASEMELSPSYMNDIEYNRRVPSDDVLRRLADRLDLNLDELLAAAGRVGIAKEAEQYIRETPRAGMLFRRVARDRLTDEQLKTLLEQVDRMRDGDTER
ncbi:helix-turn-helix transcriptional regulator [Mycobacterium heidelbergense]|uniref:Uncharacterized protein n=1 Tax=Mycobacterium heidelbergense TaxID=53376 RepID=A0A1X0DT68_MYCHE|nr:helix-turn-helix transcriptional regulator [Mycobacterium heidelbergense]MCV7051903.1 helix-turn-helix transcriptional regulator [Mycobacterium heidelbergense]ORA75050.1 hypothetical protein BST25_06035 [Mycobacterium heidelbergense]BBZ49098.1 hypothetical protein MHEI_08150 [Mycobacterium heidelbergense]